MFWGSNEQHCGYNEQNYALNLKIAESRPKMFSSQKQKKEILIMCCDGGVSYFCILYFIKYTYFSFHAMLHY